MASHRREWPALSETIAKAQAARTPGTNKSTYPDEGKTVAKLKSSVSRLQQAVKGI
jgi:hypothetical protein